jgi:NAD-dependent SIR2 family protein deacetylase
MANRLRAFISSTMDDLGNERRAVVKTLKKMGVEPVYAEEFATSGDTSWDVIYRELASAHVFVLILGDRYGWVPTSGHGSNLGLSVTHLELRAARELNKPVLVFMKRLAYGAPTEASRDEFRREVSDWKSGVFREEFDWADDLADKVWGAMTNLWQDSLLRALVQRTTDLTPKISPSPVTRATTSSGPQRVLLAGAGMSVAAGYPTAPFLMRLMADDLWGEAVKSEDLLPFSFSALASFYSAKFGDDALRECVAKALDTPQEVIPTSAHMAAVRNFSSIITTNYDELFEQACASQGIPFRVIYPFAELPEQTGTGTIDVFKLVGSVSDAKSMLITERQLESVLESKACEMIATLLECSELFVVGHGLRDGNVDRLLSNRSSAAQGFYVSPFSSQTDEVLCLRYGLRLVRQTADDFMTTLEVGQPRD